MSIYVAFFYFKERWENKNR